MKLMEKIKRLFEKLSQAIGPVGSVAAVGMVLSVAAHATPTSFQIPNDTIKQGRFGSTLSKGSVFDFGLGASNPSTLIDNATKTWAYNYNNMTMGDGLASDKKFKLDIGLGAANPFLIWSAANQDWEFSNDGITSLPLGSGSGGGGGINYLGSSDNPGFEAGTAGWAASGGSFTIDSSTQLFGKKSAVFDASASGQTLRSNAKPIQLGLSGQSCIAMISYKYAAGSDGDYVLEVWNGSSVISQVTQLKVDTTGSTQTAVAGFSCPAAGTVAVEIKSVVSNPPAIEVDGPKQNAGSVQLGSNILLGNFGSAEFYGSGNYVPIDTCSWTVSQATYAGDFPANTNCNAMTMVGDLSAPTTKVPAFRMLNAAPATYEVFIQASQSAGSGHDTCRIVDESNTQINEAAVGDSSVDTPFVLHGFVTYANTADHTFRLQCRNDTAASLEVRDFATGGYNFWAYVNKFPTTTSTTIGGLDTTAQSYTAYVDSCSSPPSTTSATWADFSNPGGCTLHQLTNTNMGTPTTSTGTNITFTPRAVGAKYEVCAYATLGITTADHPLLRLVEVGGTAQDLFEQSSGAPGAAGMGNGCGIYTATSTSAVTLKLQGSTAGGTESISTFTTAGTLRGVIEWKIIDISNPFPMVALVPDVNTELFMTTPNGHGAVDTKVRGFSVVQSSTGSAVTHTYTANNGSTFTINAGGLFAITTCDYYSASDSHIGLTKNSAALTTNIEVQSAGVFLIEASTGPALQACAAITTRLAAGDVIRAMDDGNNNCVDQTCNFRITQVAR